MTRHLKHTELWEHQPNGKSYLMNTISGGSRFFEFKVPENLHTEEAQLEVATNLKNGWVTNGPYGGIYRYEIVHVFMEQGREVRVPVK